MLSNFSNHSFVCLLRFSEAVLGQSLYIHLPVRTHNLMEGNTNWKPNEQGGNRDAANNRIDWRSQHEPELRQKVLSKM